MALLLTTNYSAMASEARGRGREGGGVAVGTEGPLGVWVLLHKHQRAGKSNGFQKDKVLTDTNILRRQSLSLNTMMSWGRPEPAITGTGAGSLCPHGKQTAATLVGNKRWVLPRGLPECRCHKPSR